MKEEYFQVKQEGEKEYQDYWIRIFNGYMMCLRNKHDRKAKLLYNLQECKIVGKETEGVENKKQN